MTHSFLSFLKNNPIKKPGVVAVVGDFNPPAAGHETVFNEAARLANAEGLQLQIYVDNTEGLLEQNERAEFLKSIFPRYKRYVTLKNEGDNTFLNSLDVQYERVVYVAREDRLVEGALPNAVERWSTGDRDPDFAAASVTTSDDMVALAEQGDYKEFYASLPSNSDEAAAKALFEAVRIAKGLPKRVPVIFNRAATREEFYSGMFQVGDGVQTVDLTEGTIAEIGANFVIVNTENGQKRFWPRDLIKL